MNKKWLIFSVIVFLVGGSMLLKQITEQKKSESQKVGEGIDEYIVYRPIRMNLKSNSKEGLYEISFDQVSKEHADKIKFVLKFYGMMFKEDNNGLKIPLSLWNNKDLLANITSKAEDSVWLKNQKYMNSKNKGVTRKTERRLD